MHLNDEEAAVLQVVSQWEYAITHDEPPFQRDFYQVPAPWDADGAAVYKRLVDRGLLVPCNRYGASESIQSWLNEQQRMPFPFKQAAPFVRTSAKTARALAQWNSEQKRRQEDEAETKGRAADRAKRTTRTQA